MRLIDADQFGVVSLQGKSEEFIEGVNFILDKIYEAPTIEERPHGEWIFEKGDGKTCCDGWGCSFCGRTFHTRVPYFAEFLFCPNCGADMREGEAE